MDRSPDTDSLCSMMEMLKMSEREKAAFQTQLTDFPHTFQLLDQERLSTNQLKRLRSGLESALSVGYTTDLETARAINLLAYALFRLDRPHDALQQLQTVLDMDSNNLVTLANMAVILRHQHRLSDADEKLESLQEIQTHSNNFHYLVVKAKAELAFSYTRLGPRFIPFAIPVFKEVLPKAKEPEKWLWKFGLALTRRRLLRALPQSSSPVQTADTTSEHRDLLKLFLDIANNTSSVSLKAKTYAEIATLLWMIWKPPLRKEFNAIAQTNFKQACERALQLDGNDNSVLCKCGKIYRYMRQTEKARDLFEKALSRRPSSTAFHHLGLTYKCLATDEKHKDKVKVPGYYRQLERQQSRGDSTQSYQTLDPQAGKNTEVPAQSGSATNRHQVHEQASENPLFSINRDVRAMQKVVKSPPRTVTHFSLNDKYVKEAMENIEKAVEVSEEENTRALYDLALLQKVLGHLGEARETLLRILNHQQNMFVADLISVYEQMGLIIKEMAESETEEAKKKRLLQDSNSMFLTSLTAASRICSRSPAVKEHIGQVWKSFSTLLEEVEMSEKNAHQKMQEKAKLFQLIKDHKQSLDLLQEIEQMDPQKANDPEHLKLKIEDYVEMEQYDKALTFVSLLECTSQTKKTMNLFEDKQFILKVYMQAARQALLQGSPMAKTQLTTVFKDTIAISHDDPSSSEDTDASEDSRIKEETWDVMILHEDSAQAKAIALTEVLEHACGLSVAIIDRDAQLGRLDLEGGLQLLNKSSLIIVLAGHKPVSRELRFFIHHAARRLSVVTLLSDGEHVPKMLKGHRSMACPSQVFHGSSSAQCGEMSKSEVDAICQVFSFLVHIDMKKAWG